MTGPSSEDTAADSQSPEPGLSPVVETRVARRRRELRPVPGRSAAVVSAAAVLIGLGVVSLTFPPPSPASPTPPGDGVRISPASARTSSLFCATGAGIGAGTGATGVVVLTNTSRSTVGGVMTVDQSSGGTAVRRAVTVPARGTTTVIPGQGLPVGATATTFTFEGGGVTATMVIGAPVGWSTAPCASLVSSEWDFVGGSTSSGVLDLSLYNPTAAQAVVGVSFLTADGNVLIPQAYQGITLAPGQLVVAELAAYVQNQQVVATLVQASSGAIVATELDRLASPTGTGLALVAGTPGPATTWRFAQTTAVQGGTVTLSVANPQASPVSVQVAVGLSSASVTPKGFTVPGHSVVAFAPSAVAGWPLGSPYSLTVVATEPVIVGRSVAAPPGGISPQAGLTGGTVTTASKWLVVGPGSPGNPLMPGATMQSLAVANPGLVPVDVMVTPLAGGNPVARVKLAANGLIVFGAAVVGGLRPLVVTSSGPVSVGVDSGPVAAPGIISSSGFPLGA